MLFRQTIWIGLGIGLVVGLGLVTLLQSSFIGTKSVGKASVGIESVRIVWCTHGDYSCILEIDLMQTHVFSKCTLRQAAPAMQTLSSTEPLLLDSTTPLLLLALACSAAAVDGVVVSAGFSAAVDDTAFSESGFSNDDGNFRVTEIPVRSSIKSHDVRARAARPSGLHPSSTASTIYK